MRRYKLKRNLKIGALALMVLCGANKVNAQAITKPAQTNISELQDSMAALHQKASAILTNYEARLLRTLHELYTGDMTLAQKQFALEQCTTQLTEYSDSVYAELNKLVSTYKNNPKINATFDVIKKQFFSTNARYERLRQEILIQVRNMRDQENEAFVDSLSKPWKEYEIQKPLKKRQRTR